MLPKDKSTFLSHIRQLSAPDKRGSAVAAVRQVRATLAAWTESAYPDLCDLKLLSAHPSAAARPEVEAFATWLRALPFLDATFWLSSAYAHLMPEALRDERALFFTPPTLATRLVSSLRRQRVRMAHSRFVDPSCGGSAFLAPVAIEVARELTLAGEPSHRIITHVESHLGGFELDPFLCELSRAFLNMALYEHVTKVGRLLEPRIVQGDALATALTHANAYDVVISNPPYRKLTAREFSLLPAAYEHLVHGQPNLYALFIDLSLRLAKPDGHIGVLTPAGFFGGRSFGPLRGLLRDQTHVTQVDFIEPRIGAFLDVEQETALTVLRKQRCGDSKTAVFVTLDGRKFASLGAYALPLEPTSPWVLPRSQAEMGAVQTFASPRWRLEDYGYAPRTGFLVPHRMPVPRLRKKGNRLWVCPLIWATQIGLDGVHHFQPGRGDHASLFVDVSEYGKQGVLTTPSVALQRTSSKDQSRRVRCAPIHQAFLDEHGGYMGENHVCFLVPIAGREPAVSVEVLATILNSDPVDRAFRCLSGTATVSAYELRAIPMPDPVTVVQAMASGLSLNEAVLAGYAAGTKPTLSERKAA